ncbi:MAG: hypothetical protein KW788_00715 [Candidatus Doudnabacteria bacterium]|nr:hypothetical protein [Candidatus Doudnabacteria bacterium]
MIKAIGYILIILAGIGALFVLVLEILSSFWYQGNIPANERLLTVSHVLIWVAVLVLGLFMVLTNFKKK